MDATLLDRSRWNGFWGVGFRCSIRGCRTAEGSQGKDLVTGGHPGDPEYGRGGMIAAFVEQGHEVVLLYLNDGAWPPTPAETRLAEAKKAGELLGARPSYAPTKEWRCNRGQQSL